MSNRPRNKPSGIKKTPTATPQKPAAKSGKTQPEGKPTSLKKTLYLAFAIVSLVIGLHRVYLDGQTESISTAILYNYWIFMITLGFLFLLRYERKKPSA